MPPPLSVCGCCAGAGTAVPSKGVSEVLPPCTKTSLPFVRAKAAESQVVTKVCLLLDAGQQIGLAAVVQLAEHVVEKHHRMLPQNLSRHAGFGQFQAQNRAALLALAAVDSPGLAVDVDLDILPVGARQAEARPELGVSHLVEFFCQSGGAGLHRWAGSAR